MNQFLVDTSGRTLDFGKRVAEFLAAIAAHADTDELVRVLAGFEDSLPPPLRELLPESLAEHELLSFLAKLGEQAGDVERELRKYLLTIDELSAAGAAWSWTRASLGRYPDTGSVTLELGAEISLAASLHGPAPGPRYVLAGELGVAGSLTAPFTYGALHAASSSSGAVTLEAHFQHSGETRVIDAVVADLAAIGRINAPQVLASSDIASVAITAAGELKLGASVELGKSWVTSPTRRGVSAEIKAGARYAIDWAHSGCFEIRVVREGTSALRVTVEEKEGTSTSRALTLGTTVAFSGVGQAAKPILDTLGALPGPVEQIVKEYGTPSDLVKEFLSTHLPESDRLRDFVGVVLGEASPDAVLEELLDAVVGRIDEKSASIVDLLEGSLSDLASDAVARLGVLEEEDRTELEALLEAELSEASGALREKLTARIRGIVEDAPQRTALVDALEEIGEQVQGAQVNLDALAARLLAPVGRLLERYRGALGEIEKAVAAVETEKLAIELARTVAAADERTSLLEFELRGFSANTVALYQRMLRGDFAEAIRAGMDPGATEVLLLDSLFERTLTRSAKTVLSINLFGAEFGWSRMLTDRLELRTDVDSIDVLIGESSIEEIVAIPNESQSLKLDATVNFIDRDASIALVARFEDATPSKQEVREYLGALEAAGLIAEGAVASLLGDNAFLQAVADQERLRLTTRLSLKRTRLEALAALSAERVLQIAILNQVDALRQVQTLRRALDKLKDRFDAATAAGVIYALRNHSPDGVKNEIGATPGSVVHDTVKARQLQMIGNSLANGTALHAFLVTFEELLERPSPRVVGGTVDAHELRTLRRANRRVAASLDEWIEVPTVIQRAFTDRMTPWTIALFTTLVELSGETGEPPVRTATVVKWADELRVLPPRRGAY